MVNQPCRILIILPGLMVAQQSAAVSFDLRTRIGDAASEPVAVELSVGESRTLAAADSFQYEIEVSPREDKVLAVLRLTDAQGEPLHRATIFKLVAADAQLSVAFVVCGERVILQDPAPAELANCTDLPQLAQRDPDPTQCIECAGAYEGIPQNIAARSRIVPPGEPGEPLVLVGRVLTSDGTPRPGVIVYAFQTDHTGVYPPPQPPRSTHSQSHGTLRGWTRSDAQGLYTFDTIRPGGYPDQGEPQHIHMVVIEPGCGSYFIEDVHFADDPRFQNLAPDKRRNVLTGIFGSGITTPIRDAAGAWHVTRDILLGRGTSTYADCDQ